MSASLLEALTAARFVSGTDGMRFMFDVLNEASADDLHLILPTAEIAAGDISAAFAVDFGTPGHKRRVLKARVRRAINLNKGDELRKQWMLRLSQKATAAMRAGRPLPANVK